MKSLHKITVHLHSATFRLTIVLIVRVPGGRYFRNLHPSILLLRLFGHSLKGWQKVTKKKLQISRIPQLVFNTLQEKLQNNLSNELKWNFLFGKYKHILFFLEFFLIFRISATVFIGPKISKISLFFLVKLLEKNIIMIKLFLWYFFR